MASVIETGQLLGQNTAARGYHVVYREHEANYCPGCGRAHWYVGRTMAECAFCSTALPLETPLSIGSGMIVQARRRSAFQADDHAYAA